MYKFVVVYILKLILFSEKGRLDILCESSSRQTIHMKCHLNFSEKHFKVLSSVVVIRPEMVNKYLA